MSGRPSPPAPGCILVITYDQTNTLFYVNGQLAATAPVSTTPFVANGINGDPDIIGGTDPGGPLCIGCQRYDLAFESFNGGVDEAAIYNYALSAAQVAENPLPQHGSNRGPKILLVNFQWLSSEGGADTPATPAREFQDWEMELFGTRSPAQTCSAPALSPAPAAWRTTG